MTLEIEHHHEDYDAWDARDKVDTAAEDISKMSRLAAEHFTGARAPQHTSVLNVNTTNEELRSAAMQVSRLFFALLRGIKDKYQDGTEQDRVGHLRKLQAAMNERCSSGGATVAAQVHANVSSVLEAPVEEREEWFEFAFADLKEAAEPWPWA